MKAGSRQSILLAVVLLMSVENLAAQGYITRQTRKVITTVVVGEVLYLESAVAIPSAREPVNVPLGSAVTLVLPYPTSQIREVSWRKETTSMPSRIVSTNATLEIPSASESDSGYYLPIVVLVDGSRPPLENLQLRVGQQRGAALLNISTRGTLSASQPFFITGFVIEKLPSVEGDAKTLLIRAVGPSLAAYGVTNALADPKIELFRSDGLSVPLSAPGYLGNYLPFAVRLAGAFEIPDGTQDVTYMVRLPVGTYSAKVSSRSGQSGAVLLEVYEVPVPF
jgi:hypothetical protein